MFQRSHYTSPTQGVSLIEALVALAMVSTVVVLTIPVLTGGFAQTNSKTWSRSVSDYFHHLASAYNTVNLKYGAGPVAATTVDNNGNPVSVYADGLASMLPDWETAITYDVGPPAVLDYPAGLRVYLKPEQAGADPNNEIDNTTIMSGTNNKEWLLLDMNGSSGSNSTTVTGDRVLIYVEDTTGQIFTAWQKCKALGGTVASNTCTYSGDDFYKSFYDEVKGY